MCKLSSLINCAIKNTELWQVVDRQTCQVWRTFIFNINNTKRSVIIKSYRKKNCQIFLEFISLLQFRNWRTACSEISDKTLAILGHPETFAGKEQSAICVYFESAKRNGFEIVAKNWPKVWRNIQIGDYLCSIYKQ